MHQVACTEIILAIGACLFFNLFCALVTKIQKVEPGYEEM